MWTASSTWEVCCPPMVTVGQISTDASAWPHQLCLLYTTFGRTDICPLAHIRIYQALVQSVLLYAAETWTPRAIDIKALEAFHMKYQRQLLQISWQQFIRNDEVAATTGLPSISEVPLRSRCETTTRCPGAQGPPLPPRPVSWSTTQRPVETSSGPTTREMDRPGPER